MSEISTELVIIALLLLANGAFAMSELAVMSARKARLKQMAEAGDARARHALAIADHPTRFLSTVQVMITLITILQGVFGGQAVAEQLSNLFDHLPISEVWSDNVAKGVVVVAITLLSVVAGELVPKRLALTNPEGIARWVAGPIGKLTWLSYPIVHLLTISTEGILKLFRVAPAKESPVTEEEVNILIEQGLHAGVFNQAETQMVAGVLELDKLAVTALMTPRPKIVFLNVDDPEESNWRKIVTSGHSHFPVFQNNRDQVVGIVSVKAIWANSALGVTTHLKNLLVPPVIVPETMLAITLLEQFKKTGQHIALVTDEFGAIQGLVTLIDVMEAIVGDMPERGQNSAPETRQRADGSWLVDATLGVADLKDMLKLTRLPHEDAADFQTLGGFVMTHFGRIPRAGDFFDFGGWRFEVVDMDRHRVDKVLIARTPTAEEEKAAV